VVDALAWLRSLRATTFAPADTALVRGEPALRRALLDRAVMTIRPDYLGPARDLRRILEHKSALLRASGDDAALDVLDEQLVAVGARVSVARSAAVRRLRPLFQTIYADLSDGESADVTYECSLGDPHDAAFEAEFAARLARARRQERALRRPLAGPQRDDVAFLVRGAPARAFASQGQARSVVLAWKLAELAVAREDGEAPMFLLDDLGSELDPDRTARLVRHVRGFGAQVFLTTTDARFLPEGAAARVYTVVGGAVRAVEA
jgi:DNA replication and repair protein RecF